MTRAQKIAKARKEYLGALVGNHLQEAQAKQRELVRLITRQIAAENKEDRKATGMAVRQRSSGTDSAHPCQPKTGVAA